jgi:hypothetical protein
MMNVTVGLTEPNPFCDLVATVQACSIITMAHLRNNNKSIYNKYVEDNLPHPLPFILETKDWKNHPDDNNDNTNTKKRKLPNDQNLKINVHVKTAYTEFIDQMNSYKSTQGCNFQR